MKINWKALQWAKALAYIAGGGCIADFAVGGPRWVLVGGAVAAVAKLVDLLLPQPTQNLTPTAQAVNHANETVGENVTTTTTAPIIAPVIKAEP